MVITFFFSYCTAAFCSVIDCWLLWFETGLWWRPAGINKLQFEAVFQQQLPLLQPGTERKFAFKSVPHWTYKQHLAWLDTPTQEWMWMTPGFVALLLSKPWTALLMFFYTPIRLDSGWEMTPDSNISVWNYPGQLVFIWEAGPACSLTTTTRFLKWRNK